ncbi:MAG: hypothetical protein QOI78_1507 [Actinomycetota bacterium]|nr:hypothetical protein [Actinomycetota bacterium]
MGGGGMPPQGGAPGGGAPGGGSPRAGGGNAGWTGTPGSPGSPTPHTPDAPGRPRVGDGPDAPGRPRSGGGDTPRPRTPEPAARGFGPGTHGPDTPGTRPGGPSTGGPGTRSGGPSHTGPGTHGPDTPGTRPGGPGGPGRTGPDHTGPGHTGPDGAAPHEHGPGHHDPDGSPDGDVPHHHDEPLSPDEVNARHAESTPAGSSYHAGDADMGDLPHRVQPDPDGRYTVDVHVTPDGHARIGDRLYTPEEFADVLRRNADYDGRPVRLIGCDASSNDFAHRLSRELDTEVTAPTKPAWTDAHGRVFSSDYEIGPDGKMRPRIPPDGEWNTHHPDGSTHRAGDDGFAPDSHHGDPHDVDADSAVDRGQRPYDPAERDRDMHDLRRENRDLREEGLDSVRHHDGRNVNPTTDDLRRPHDRALTTSRYRSLEGGVEDIHSFSGMTDGRPHDWAPASESPNYPKHERLFGTREAGTYRPELGEPDPNVKFGRTHDSEPRLMEELVRRDFAERSGLPREEVDDIVKKQIEKQTREEKVGTRTYESGLKGDIARAQDRMDGALDEINRRGAERAQARGETYTPVTRDGMDGDLRMVVDLPAAKRDNIPVDYQICDSCQDVFLQFEKLFPNVRLEVVNLKGEELIW